MAKVVWFMRARGRLFLDPFRTECLAIVLYLRIGVSLQVLLINGPDYVPEFHTKVPTFGTNLQGLCDPLSPTLTSTTAGIGTLIKRLSNHKFLICVQRKVVVPGNDLEIYLLWSQPRRQKSLAGLSPREV
jgi:hypothetical protein